MDTTPTQATNSTPEAPQSTPVAPITPPPTAIPSTPVGATPITPQPVSAMPPPPIMQQPTMTMPSMESGKKGGKGMIIFAVILVIFILALGALYFVMGQSKNKTNKPSTPAQVKLVPTSPPVATPTVTPPNDEETLNAEVPDETEDAQDLNKDVLGL